MTSQPPPESLRILLRRDGFYSTFPNVSEILRQNVFSDDDSFDTREEPEVARSYIRRIRGLVEGFDANGGQEVLNEGCEMNRNIVPV